MDNKAGAKSADELDEDLEKKRRKLELDEAFEKEIAKRVRRDEESAELPSPVVILGPPSPSSTTTTTTTVVMDKTMETLLLQSLSKLSPDEIKRYRQASYPIFKDNSRDMSRDSYLFDEIPFDLERPLDKKHLMGAYDVVYHDEKIDWGAFRGWEVLSTKRPHSDIGLLIVGRATENSHELGGGLVFIPHPEEEDNEEYSEADENISDGSEEDEGPESDGSHLGTDNEDEDEEQNSESEEVEGNNRNEDEEERDERGESDDGGNEEEQDEGDESDDGSHSGSEITDGDVGNKTEYCTFLQFDERRFVLDSDYKRASWFCSRSACHFGVVNARSEGATTGGKSSVTLFRANETVAFERSDQQRFVSLENPSNYGTEGGPHGDPELNYEDDTHRMHVMERMQAYRGSWIHKLPPSSITIPDDVVNMIWEFWQTGPPPFLFVRKGDVLLLARCEESLPDPDGFPCAVTVTREHLVLAHPCEDEPP